jgi:hypothetical protein
MPVRANTTFTTTAPVAPAKPDHASEVIFAYFGVDEDESDNRNTTGPTFSNIGTGPTYAAAAATMGVGNGINTGLPMTMSAITIMAIVKPTTGGGGTYRRIANFEGNLVVYWHNSTNVVTAYGGNGSGYQASLTVPNDGAYHFIAVTMGTGGVVEIYDMTDGTASVDGGAATITSNATKYLCLNAALEASTQTNALSWLGVIVVSARLTSAEIDEYYDYTQAALSRCRGQTI